MVPENKPETRMPLLDVQVTDERWLQSAETGRERRHGRGTLSGHRGCRRAGNARRHPCEGLGVQFPRATHPTTVRCVGLDGESGSRTPRPNPWCFDLECGEGPARREIQGPKIWPAKGQVAHYLRCLDNIAELPRG